MKKIQLGHSDLHVTPICLGTMTFGGGFDKDGKPVGRLTHFPPTWSPRYGRPETVLATRRYIAIARAYGLAPTALAIAFCLHKSCIASTIVGATSVAQLGECLDSADVVLEPDLLQAIDAVRWEMRDPAQ